MEIVTVFKVMSGSYCIDQANTQQWLTAEVALQKAKEMRDRYNASEFVTSGKGEVARIVRAFRRNTARPL